MSKLDELLTELRSGTINFDDKAKKAILGWAKKREKQEHYISDFGSVTGTGNHCACGMSFKQLYSIKGHIEWNLAALKSSN